jgi:hypothetical protein
MLDLETGAESWNVADYTFQVGLTQLDRDIVSARAQKHGLEPLAWLRWALTAECWKPLPCGRWTDEIRRRWVAQNHCAGFPRWTVQFRCPDVLDRHVRKRAHIMGFTLASYVRYVIAGGMQIDVHI